MSKMKAARVAKKKAEKAAALARGNDRVIATNRRARHDYEILETYEAGLVLVGTEGKSLREGKVSLNDAFATVDDGELWLRGLHIPEDTHGSRTTQVPTRTRKMMTHRRQTDAL